MIAYGMLRKSEAEGRQYYGIVVEVSEVSPKARVLVPGVLQGDTDVLPWAQFQNSLGNDGHGQVWTPRLGSKVFVRFPTADANHPVIVGAYNVSPAEFDGVTHHTHGWADLKGNYLKIDEENDTFVLSLVSGVSVNIAADGSTTITTQALTVEATSINMNSSEAMTFESATSISMKAASGITVDGGSLVDVDASLITFN